MANRSTGIYGHFGSFSATNQLPNVAGADVQTSEVQVGDIAAVAGALYICTTATLGAAVWAAVGGGGGYSYSDTYTPALTHSGYQTGGIIGLLGAGALGVQRIGSGDGAPSAGDTVTVVGAFSLGDIGDGDTTTFPLPFEAALDPYPFVEIIDPTGDIVTVGALDSPTVCGLLFTVTGDTDTVFRIRITYQTANAVDAS